MNRSRIPRPLYMASTHAAAAVSRVNKALCLAEAPGSDLRKLRDLCGEIEQIGAWLQTAASDAFKLAEAARVAELEEAQRRGESLAADFSVQMAGIYSGAERVRPRLSVISSDGPSAA